MAVLPLRANHAFGALLGWLFWLLPNRNRSNTLVNLALCYPQMPRGEVQKLARLSLLETGKALTEIGWLWYRPLDQVQRLIEFPDQSETFAAIPLRSEPTILATPHFGAWEFCPPALGPLQDPIFLYRSPRTTAIEPLIKKGRERYGAELVALDNTGLKYLLRSLRQGRPIGILPDQEPDPDAGVFADFLGIPANTMTLLPRLAAKSNAHLTFLVIERKPKGRGYRVHNVPPEPGIKSTDIHIATRALNRTVERCIEIDPRQYCWSYRRFRWLPDGGRRDYSEKK